LCDVYSRAGQLGQAASAPGVTMSIGRLDLGDLATVDRRAEAGKW
jgi:hypothetical protein